MKTVAQEFNAVLLNMYGPRLAHLSEGERGALQRMFFAGWFSAIADNYEMVKMPQAAANARIQARQMECKNFFGVKTPQADDFTNPRAE